MWLCLGKSAEAKWGRANPRMPSTAASMRTKVLRIFRPSTHQIHRLSWSIHTALTFQISGSRSIPIPLACSALITAALGGGGVPVNALDAACKAHDACYAAAGISAANNAASGSMTLQQAAAAQACNAALGAAAAANPGTRGSTRVSEWLKHGDQLLPLLGIDGHLAPGTAVR